MLKCLVSIMRWLFIYIFCWLILGMENVSEENVTSLKFPHGFKFGVGSSAYQIEGAWNEDGKGENIWDKFTHEKSGFIKYGSNADISCDSYNKWKDDVAMVSYLGADFYKFSLSWTRILPGGHANVINGAGVTYYNKLIDRLLSSDVMPFVTLYHWDLPQELQDLGGWANDVTTLAFVDYADLAFKLFGDRVKMWVTIEEPIKICKAGYGDGTYAPGVKSSGIGDYLCGKNVLMAHALTYRLYEKKYKKEQKGIVGIVISASRSEPVTKDPDNVLAAERKTAMEASISFQIGWFADPIFSGTADYPSILVKRIYENSLAEGYMRSRLPLFSKDEKKILNGSSDFFGITHFTTFYLSMEEMPKTDPASYWKDVGVKHMQDASWGVSALPWLRVVPWGFKRILRWIKRTYQNPNIYVMACGYPDVGGLNDSKRISYIKEYLHNLLLAVNEEKCKVKAFSYWSLMDQMEWVEGYTVKYGLYKVEFSDANKTRKPKASAEYYKSIIAAKTLIP